MINLYQVQGSENKFVLFDQTQFSHPLPMSNLIKLTKLIASSKLPFNNIDGMLVVNSSPHAECSGKMTVINRDGSLASMCGNGLRTVSRYLALRNHRDHFKVETAKSDLRVARRPDFAPGVPAFGVEISPVTFEAPTLPFTHLQTNTIVNLTLPQIDPHLKFTAIAVPNPHLISFVTDLKSEVPNLARIGKFLNGENQYFPEGVNVSFAQIIDDSNLFVKTYERGVGFTNACGTGMSATSLAYLLTQSKSALFEHPLTVYNPGGMVRTIVHQSQPTKYWIELIGNATFMNEITFNEHDVLTPDNWKVTPTNEEKQYHKWIDALPQVL